MKGEIHVLSISGANLVIIAKILEILPLIAAIIGGIKLEDVSDLTVLSIAGDSVVFRVSEDRGTQTYASIVVRHVSMDLQSGVFRVLNTCSMFGEPDMAYAQLDSVFDLDA